LLGTDVVTVRSLFAVSGSSLLQPAARAAATSSAQARRTGAIL
jgi:hypothetical protein